MRKMKLKVRTIDDYSLKRENEKVRGATQARPSKQSKVRGAARGTSTHLKPEKRRAAKPGKRVRTKNQTKGARLRRGNEYSLKTKQKSARESRGNEYSLKTKLKMRSEYVPKTKQKFQASTHLKPNKTCASSTRLKPNKKRATPAGRRVRP